MSRQLEVLRVINTDQRTGGQRGCEGSSKTVKVSFKKRTVQALSHNQCTSTMHHQVCALVTSRD